MKFGGIFDKKLIINKISALQEKTNLPDFWDNSANAKKILKKISTYEQELKMWDQLEMQLDELDLYVELLDEGEKVENPNSFVRRMTSVMEKGLK